MSRCALSEALVALLPGSFISRRRAYDWHSATFSGQRLVLDIRTVTGNEQAEAFAQILGEREFALPQRLVADIMVTARKGNLLTVEALLLDDEI
jgi:hypothetical protein